jgi:type IV secretion system protein VirD4
MLAAEAMARLVGFGSPEQLLDLDDDEILLQLSGDMPVIARLPNYRADPIFGGLYDANPFHDPSRPVQKPRPVTRVFERSPAAAQADTPAEVLARLRARSTSG